MKLKLTNQDWIFIAVTGLFSYLFYRHPLGINLLIYNVVLIAIQLLLRKDRRLSLPLITCTIGTISTAFTVVLINSSLATFANFISFIVFTGYCTLSGSSFFIALMTAAYSILASSFIHFARYIQSDKKGKNPAKSSSQLKLFKLASIIIPIAVACIFVTLYANANPVFANAIDTIQIDFISFGWFRFTFIAGLFLFGVIYKITIDPLQSWDENTSNNVIRIRKGFNSTTHNLALKYEFKMAIAILALLNAVILCFNIFDINLLLGGRLPDGYTYSEYVHQGVNTLISSIILAILIILYFLRANLNFYSKNKYLIGLAYFWIIQNIVLVAGIIYKNNAYIFEYGLTYKRIGVYVYLALALFGLFTTIYKVRFRTNHWHLLRINSWLAYVILVLSSCFNWDAMITTFNLSLEKRPDYAYLINLSDANLSILLVNKKSGAQMTYPETNLLKEKRRNFLEDMEQKNWQSWNYQDQKNYEFIQHENE